MSDELVSLGTAEKYRARAEAAESALASLRAAITAKAEKYEREAEHWTAKAEMRSSDNRANCYALASKYSDQAATLRALAAHQTKEGNE